ncbi:MAG: polysaccharide biosynthesis/export family protein [Verrucomicrobiota bacterium]
MITARITHPALIAATTLGLVGWTSQAQDDQVVKIRPGDVLSIVVFQEPDLSNEKAMVDKSGSLSVELLGDVRVAGKTVSSLGKFLREAYQKDYLVDPQVTVSIVSPSTQRFVIVTGMVNSPGPVAFEKKEWVTLQRAIQAAGGLTPKADASRITIRKEGEATPLRTVNLSSIRRGESPRVTLLDGHEVFVP